MVSPRPKHVSRCCREISTFAIHKLPPLDDIAVLDGSIVLLGARHEHSLVVLRNTDLGVLAVEDLCNLFERGALGLDVEEVDEDKLERDPALRIELVYAL